MCTDPLLHKQIPIIKKCALNIRRRFTWAKTNKDRIKNYYFKV